MSLGLGLGFAWWFSGRDTSKALATVAHRERQTDETEPTYARAQSEALTVMQQRLNNLERSVAAPTADSTRSPRLAEVPASEQVHLTSPEEERRQVIALRDTELKAFEVEGYDPAWSTSTRTAFQQDLKALSGDKNYQIKSVECKTTLCRAVVHWNSYDEVRSTAGELMHAMYRTNCTKTLFAPRPEDPKAPYDGTVMYDCTSLRTGDSQ
jgi:hypothetical protein